MAKKPSARRNLHVGPSPEAKALPEQLRDRLPELPRRYGVEDELTASLGRRVDLVMKSALKPRLAQRILEEAVACGRATQIRSDMPMTISSQLRRR